MNYAQLRNYDMMLLNCDWIHDYKLWLLLIISYLDLGMSYGWSCCNWIELLRRIDLLVLKTCVLRKKLLKQFHNLFNCHENECTGDGYVFVLCMNPWMLTFVYVWLWLIWNLPPVVLTAYLFVWMGRRSAGVVCFWWVLG